MNYARVAAGIAVGDASLIGDRDGFEAAVRMLADSTRIAGRKYGRPGIVEHQERADLVLQTV